MSIITACLDSNVIVSGIAFRGKPFKVLEHALAREFQLVLTPIIREEVHRNLVGKLGLTKKLVDKFLQDLFKEPAPVMPLAKQPSRPWLDYERPPPSPTIGGKQAAPLGTSHNGPIIQHAPLSCLLHLSIKKNMVVGINNLLRWQQSRQGGPLAPLLHNSIM